MNLEEKKLRRIAHEPRYLIKRLVASVLDRKGRELIISMKLRISAVTLKRSKRIVSLRTRTIYIIKKRR